ncbi:hypothetical protein [Maribacter sp. 2-571]|uniref:hypothetical protein n=1 Tax=Maribacter sp. 2-571 TaxID=3417569 RepID=UPI003D32DDAE
MIDNDYLKIVSVFEKNEKSFNARKEKMNSTSFSKINWSDSYLDFTPYYSITNQLGKTTIFETEKLDSIKNHFFDNTLIYSYKNANENWGSVFIDYLTNSKMWFLFVENDSDEMMLQQVRVVCFEDDKITKQLFYLLDKDAEEETFMKDIFNYNEESELQSINRNGFYEMKSTILPETKFAFEYDNDNMKVYASQEVTGTIKKHLIYDGKRLGR